MKLKTKYLNHLGKDDIIQSRMGIPEDYHCTCNLCDPETFMGEIYNLDHDTYYSNRIRRGYYVNKEIADIILNDNMDLVPEGWFIHRHVPTTVFMNTYPKRCPGGKIPFYQTGIILRKE